MLLIDNLKAYMVQTFCMPWMLYSWVPYTKHIHQMCANVEMGNIERTKWFQSGTVSTIDFGVRCIIYASVSNETNILWRKKISNGKVV